MTSSQPPQQPGYGPPPAGSSPYGQQPSPGQNPYGQPAGSGGQLSFDVKRLKMADYVVAGGALLYLLFAILPWYSDDIDYGFGVTQSFSVNGFDLGTITTSFVLLIIAALWVLSPAVAPVRLPFPRSLVTVGLAGLALLLTFIGWIDAFDLPSFSFFALLTFLTALAVAAFAVLSLLPELKNRPGLPGGLANAAQWANQQAPAFGPGQGPGQGQGQGPGQGHPGQQPYGQPPAPQQPYGQPQQFPQPGQPGQGPNPGQPGGY